MTEPQYGDLPEVETEGTEVVHGADGPPADEPAGIDDMAWPYNQPVGPYVTGETPAFDPEHIVDAMDGWNHR